MGRIQWGYERFPPCSENLSAPPETYFKRFYYDTVCRNVPALRMALSMFGVDHILFGTDIPFREDIDLQLKDLEDLDLSKRRSRGDRLRQCGAAAWYEFAGEQISRGGC